MKKAYTITITTWPAMEIVVVARTPGKAKYPQYVAAVEAGYKIPFTNFRARRAPEFDELAVKTPAGGWLGWRDDVSTWGCLAKGA